MSKNSQNTDKNVEKPSKYRPKYFKTVKPVEKSLKTVKNIEKTQNDKNCRKPQICSKTGKIPTKMS